MSATHRTDGFAPIEDYAVLGDGRTVALLATDGSVDWWPLPALDSPPVLSRLLDPDGGGRLTLAPSADYEVTRQYLDDTNVVETVYTTATGVARVTAALNVGSAGRLPWTELAQRIDILAGFVDLEWAFIPGDRFGRANPWVTSRHGTPVASIEDQTLGVILRRPPARRDHPARHFRPAAGCTKGPERFSPSWPPTPNRSSSQRLPPSRLDWTGP